MAFNNEDILTLAKAGFTKEDIAKLSTLGASIGQPAAPEVPPTGEPAPQTGNQPEMSQAPQANKVEEQTATPATQSQMDQIMSAITGIRSEVQNMFLQNASQSGAQGPQTSEQILAEIINPTRKEIN